MQLQPLSTGNFYITLCSLFQVGFKKRNSVWNTWCFLFFLNFQYQLIARDHKSLQCDLGNILKPNKCILCVPHLFKKRECLLSLFSRCRKNSKFDYRRVTIKKRNLTQMYRMAFLYILSTIPLFFISMSYNKINGERIKGLQNL